MYRPLSDRQHGVAGVPRTVRSSHEHRFERPADLAELAEYLRSHPALRAKSEIKLVSEVLGGGSWVHGPGDDGAVGGRDRVCRRPGGHDQVIACGEALLPAFVASDPYGAGVAAVLTNVNDLAAMGAVPLAIVDTIVGSTELAREALRGMNDACGWYDVALAGGHLTVHDGPPAVSAFGVGRADAVLSTTNVAAGQSLIVAACTTGDDAYRLSVLPVVRGAGRRSWPTMCASSPPWRPRATASRPRTSAWPGSSVRWRCCWSGAASG